MHHHYLLYNIRHREKTSMDLYYLVIQVRWDGKKIHVCNLYNVLKVGKDLGKYFDKTENNSELQFSEF